MTIRFPVVEKAVNWQLLESEFQGYLIKSCRISRTEDEQELCDVQHDKLTWFMFKVYDKLLQVIPELINLE